MSTARPSPYSSIHLDSSLPRTFECCVCHLPCTTTNKTAKTHEGACREINEKRVASRRKKRERNIRKASVLVGVAR